MAIIKTAGVFLINKDLKLLVAHPTNHPVDFWSIPKGKIDEGESELSGALRELYEESNVDFRDRIFLYHEFNYEVFNNKRKKLKPYVILESKNNVDFNSFELKCNSHVEPERGGFPEMDDYKWITLDEAEKCLHHTQVACISKIKDLIKTM